MVMENCQRLCVNAWVLTEIYIEALLVDEELADQVWGIFDQGDISEELAEFAWLLIASRFSTQQ